MPLILGLNNTAVDQQFLFSIMQNADFGSKVAAIKHYNELKGRVKKPDRPTAIRFNSNLEGNNGSTEDMNRITIEAKGTRPQTNYRKSNTPEYLLRTIMGVVNFCLFWYIGTQTF